MRALPIHPLINDRAGSHIRGGKPLVPGVPPGQVSKDRVGFPQGEAVILYRWHATVRIPGQVIGCVGPAERTPYILPDIGHAEFLARPDNLPHVG
ncbi:hypothetical protein D9M69_621910 [compost metagenome]